MSQGIVHWFNSEKGFGFITPDEGGPEIFVHHSALQATGLRHLGQNARVAFDIAQGPRGPQAINVHKES
jgi:CspA family cold shock protein